jgi:prepilin signal peptidase PulO-like enzyme (type II secretory pathway)
MMEQFGNVYASLYPWLMGVLTVIVSLTDLRWYWVPDTAVAALILIQLAALRAGLVRPDPYVSAGVWIFMLILYTVSHGRMGRGDLKLLLPLVIGCNGISAYGMLVFAFLTGALVAVPLRVVWSVKYVPFAPFLLAGWWVSLIFYEEWLSWLCV